MLNLKRVEEFKPSSKEIPTKQNTIVVGEKEFQESMFIGVRDRELESVDSEDDDELN